MKKVLSTVLTALFLMVVLTTNSFATMDPCVVKSTHGKVGTWTEGACYSPAASCTANICP